MYIFGPTTRRCSLCYALLFTHTHTTSATLSYSSSNRRHASRCSISSIQRLISSSTKFQRLWRQNQNGIFKNPPMCFRCCNALRQVDQIKIDIEQLDHEKQLLMKRIEHNLSKRALILQAQRRRTSPCLTPPFIYQVIRQCFARNAHLALPVSVHSAPFIQRRRGHRGRRRKAAPASISQRTRTRTICGPANSSDPGRSETAQV